jgi:hypothetical protein
VKYEIVIIRINPIIAKYIFKSSLLLVVIYPPDMKFKKLNIHLLLK